MAWWEEHTWSAEWLNNASRLHSFIPIAGPCPPGLALTRPVWTRLNHLRTSVGCFCSSIYKWGSGPFCYVSVAWRIKLQTILYKDVNTCHQMAFVVCRSWMTTLSNGSRSHVPNLARMVFGLHKKRRASS